jgi:hypothetical protein
MRIGSHVSVTFLISARDHLYGRSLATDPDGTPFAANHAWSDNGCRQAFFLLEGHSSMNNLSHETSHRQHLADDSDHTAWLDDIARWREANRHALTLLTSLQARIVEHDEDLLGHEQVILAHAQQLKRHEAEIAEHERSGNAGESARHQEEHHGFIAKHITERERHGTLNQNQRQVQVVIQRLEKVLHTCH